MPFGLCNASATFEKLMERVLKGLHWKTSLVYLDDIIVMFRTFNEHLKNLGEVLPRISMAKIKRKEILIYPKTGEIFGNLVTADAISADEDRIRAVKDWPQPQNLQELRSITYYSRFVPNIGSVAAILHELTKKSKVYQ